MGTYMAWGVNNRGWRGEGEIKFYIDDDRDYPTICGTGTEDYFCFMTANSASEYTISGAAGQKLSGNYLDYATRK